MAASGELAPGTVFAGRYRVEHKLSEGGMGAVYAVTQIGIERPRALKLMHPELARDETLRSRFRQEALVGARIESDHVVQVHDADVDEATRTPYLCMELLQGSDLEDFVGLHGRMSRDAVALVSRQLCHALARAHAAGVVHRDLKPANLFLAQTRHADAPFVLKVLDFGIAKCVAEAATRGNTTGLIGSPLWLAPEQANPKQTIGPATDIWAYGLIVYYLLAGEAFWLSAREEAPGIQMVLAEVLVSDMPPASDRARETGCEATLPAGFDAWFTRCTARDPVERFTTITEAHDALTPLLDASAPPSGLRASGSAQTHVPGVTPPPASVTLPALPAIAPLPGAGLKVATRPASNGRWRVAMLAAAGACAVTLAAVWSRKPEPVDQTPTAVSRDAKPPRSGELTAIHRLVSVSAPTVQSAATPPAPSRDTTDMVLVPAGPFTMGCAQGDWSCHVNETPQHEVHVDGFHIDMMEVTVDAYGRCVSAGSCTPPSTTDHCNWGRAERSDHPVNCVDWHQATAFCGWVGKRLPTEAEWEKAARGADGRLYPWGASSPSSEVCWRRGTSKAGTCAAGSHPSGASPYGALDLAGNVWEWTADWYDKAYYGSSPSRNPEGPPAGSRRVVRGGDWFYDAARNLRASHRYSHLPDGRGHSVGFRCACSAP